MLERLLPLVNSIKNLNPLQKRQEDPRKNNEAENIKDQPKSPFGPNDINQSDINLIQAAAGYHPPEFTFKKFNHFFVVVVLIIYVVFVELVGYNAQLDYKIDKLKGEQEKWVRLIESYDQELDVGRDIERKSKEYRRVLESRTLYEERIHTLYYLLPEGVTMNQLEITPEEFEIELEADNVLAFARLIILYLGSDIISEVSIESAELNSGTGIYTIKFTGLFNVT